MKKIAVITATRAEYGLLSPVIRELRKQESGDLRVELIVTGTHLSEEYGLTVNEIKERIDHKVAISILSGSELNISENQADCLEKFTTLFVKERYDAVLLLGDRYETLAIAIAAGNTKTPVFHLCGGDTTEGAWDEWIRHCISKISYLHFVTNEISKKRVIQLGEDPSRVFNFGSTSIDNILSAADMTREQALESIGLSDCRYAICTYHPVTLDDSDIDELIRNFLDAVSAFPAIEFIVTKSNADLGGARINALLDAAEQEVKNLHVHASLGVHRYLSLMKYSEFVLGNSSSGIIEAPAFHIPTVNIGDRQRGRLQSESTINCAPSSKAIIEAINRALSEDHKSLCQKVRTPYGDGHAAELISETTIKTVFSGNIDLKKKFYDLEV
ncbi:MAG: UDP-N-acetylglucosamine 2-epimerase (hydrolyzing) [Lachnospiraceae bacterium]|nr:UDP-N-acetylglucosamine 2-epimerase (hydrolyzing) [Lachnospiraceae bacterium]